MSKERSWIENFGVKPVNPGYVYLIKNDELYKIGKTKSKDARLKAARTWLPNIEVIGVKPFWGYSDIERLIHVGFVRCWYDGEWLKMLDEGYEYALIDGFKEFSDTDIDKNSVDFIYWFNSGGMAEFVHELNSDRTTLPKFRIQESDARKKK